MEIPAARNLCETLANKAAAAYDVKEAGGSLQQLLITHPDVIKPYWDKPLKDINMRPTHIGFAANSRQDAYNTMYNECKSMVKSVYGILI